MPFSSRDLTSQHFGRLVVKHRDTSQRDTRHTYWYCQCSCGETATVRADHLLSGSTQSCGCLAIKYAEEIAGASDLKGAVIKGWDIIRKATQYERRDVLCLKPSVSQSYWLCRCPVCGAERFFGGPVLRRGKVGACRHR